MALLVALVTVALLATGFAGTSLLRTYLVQQQRDDLQEQARQLEANVGQALQVCDRGFRYPGDTLLACADGTGYVVVSGGSRAGADLPDLGGIGPATIASWDGGPFTLAAADRSTSWLLLAAQVTDDRVVVVGLDLAGDQEILGRLVVIEVVVGLLVLLVLGVAGYLVVRSSLRPLVEVEHTAAAIAAGDLSRRVPEGDDRTEVGRLSRALNGMLGRIEGAFRAQADVRGAGPRRRRPGCAGSSPTPATSCGRR